MGQWIVASLSRGGYFKMNPSVDQVAALLVAIESAELTIEQAIAKIKPERSCWTCQNRLDTINHDECADCDSEYSNYTKNFKK